MLCDEPRRVTMISKVPIQPKSLVDGISALETRFRRAMGDSRRLDRVRGFGGPNNPYDDFAPPLGRLFQRTRQASDEGKMELARDAYAALFAVLALKDDYGFSITRPDGLVIRDEQARYLRALGQTAEPGARSVLLIQTKRRLTQSLWEGCDTSIQTVLEIAPLTVGERDEWLDDLIGRLGQDREPDADRWLREAVRLRSGGNGLRDLARRESPWRPRAWLDWLETFTERESPNRMIEAAEEALAQIPEGLELRATAADHLARAATILGDRNRLIVARWEAFRAEPFPDRLLDLWLAAANPKDQRAWMRRVATAACDSAGGLIPGPLVDGFGSSHEVLLKEDGDYFTSGPSDEIVACARLLAGDWRGAFRMACGETFPDWVGNRTIPMLVLPVMMAWLMQWPKKELPSNIAELLNAAVGLFAVPGEVHSRPDLRLKLALSESIPRWKRAPAAISAKVVDRCLRLVRKGIAAALKNPDLDRNGRVALLAAAAAETLRERRSEADAVEFLDELARTHGRRSEFVDALRLRWHLKAPSPAHATWPNARKDDDKESSPASRVE